MPHKRADKFGFTYPDWVEAIEDKCLRETLREALFARGYAVRAGAFDRKDTRAEIEAGDATLEQIEYGRITGSEACKKVASVIRKYTHALKETEAPKVKHRRKP